MSTSSIEKLLKNKLSDQQLIPVIEWWDNDHANVSIHHFTFKIPAYGGIIAPDAIALNTIVKDPMLIIFLLAHEAKHLDQYAQDPQDFMDGYFGTVERDELKPFLEAYRRIESEANDYAFKTMSDLGFEDFANNYHSLRGNESAGSSIYRVIKQSINAGAKDLFEVITLSIM